MLGLVEAGVVQSHEEGPGVAALRCGRLGPQDALLLDSIEAVLGVAPIDAEGDVDLEERLLARRRQRPRSDPFPDLAEKGLGTLHPLAQRAPLLAGPLIQGSLHGVDRLLDVLEAQLDLLVLEDDREGVVLGARVLRVDVDVDGLQLLVLLAEEVERGERPLDHQPIQAEERLAQPLGLGVACAEVPDKVGTGDDLLLEGRLHRRLTQHVGGDAHLLRDRAQGATQPGLLRWRAALLALAGVGVGAGGAAAEVEAPLALDLPLLVGGPAGEVAGVEARLGRQAGHHAVVEEHAEL